MCQSYWLCLLEVSKSRHVCVDVLIHKSVKSSQKLVNKLLELDDLVSYIELHVQCDLVVPASSGVELFAHIADPVDEICLDKAVYIFVF